LSVLLWFLLAAAVVAALGALARARRLATRLERLSESYWELRYEYGQLNARLSRLEGTAEGTPAAPARETPAAFVPLSSLKKM
jgi:hypothetical protein